MNVLEPGLRGYNDHPIFNRPDGRVQPRVGPEQALKGNPGEGPGRTGKIDEGRRLGFPGEIPVGQPPRQKGGKGRPDLFLSIGKRGNETAEHPIRIIVKIGQPTSSSFCSREK